jgi:hypothetical protein
MQSVAAMLSLRASLPVLVAFLPLLACGDDAGEPTPALATPIGAPALAVVAGHGRLFVAEADSKGVWLKQRSLVGEAGPSTLVGAADAALGGIAVGADSESWVATHSARGAVIVRLLGDGSAQWIHEEEPRFEHPVVIRDVVALADHQVSFLLDQHDPSGAAVVHRVILAEGGKELARDRLTGVLSSNPDAEMVGLPGGQIGVLTRGADGEHHGLELFDVTLAPGARQGFVGVIRGVAGRADGGVGVEEELAGGARRLWRLGAGDPLALPVGTSQVVETTGGFLAVVSDADGYQVVALGEDEPSAYLGSRDDVRIDGIVAVPRGGLIVNGRLGGVDGLYRVTL